MLGFSKGIEMQQTLENVVKCLWSYDCSLYKLIISYEGAIVLVSQLVGGHEALLTGNQRSPSPQSSSKDGRATDSCFALTGAHQSGILMVDVG